MNLELHHFVEYDFEEPASIVDVIESLQANEHLLHQATRLIETTIAGIKFKPTTISVREISKNSPLREALAVVVVMTYQEDLEREIPALYEALTGQAVSDKYDTLLTVLVMLIAVYAISHVSERIFGRKPANLTKNSEELLDQASKELGVEKGPLRTALDTMLNSKAAKRVSTAARRFFRPVIGREGASIRSTRGLNIPTAAVEEVPTAALLAAIDDDETFRTELFRDVIVEMHAMDRDRSKSGWAGVITTISPDRVRVLLDKELSAETLFGRTELRGDVLAVWVLDEEKSETLKEYHLLHITD